MAAAEEAEAEREVGDEFAGRIAAGPQCEVHVLGEPSKIDVSRRNRLRPGKGQDQQGAEGTLREGGAPGAPVEKRTGLHGLVVSG